MSAIPKPGPSESFNDYLKRVDWKEEAIFFAMIAVGCTRLPKSWVSQASFLMSLEDMADSLYKFRKELSEAWPKH